MSLFNLFKRKSKEDKGKESTISTIQSLQVEQDNDVMVQVRKGLKVPVTEIIDANGVKLYIKIESSSVNEDTKEEVRNLIINSVSDRVEEHDIIMNITFLTRKVCICNVTQEGEILVFEVSIC